MSIGKLHLRQDVDLRGYTHIKIGGKAKRFFLIDSDEDFTHLMRQGQESFYVLGGGSNLLIKETVITTPIIKLGTSLCSLRPSPPLAGKCILEVGAATPLDHVLNYCLEHALSGMEEFAGIPATIGGLVVMNASAFGKEIAQLVEAVEVVDAQGRPQRMGKDTLRFGYRYSSLTDFLLVRVWLRLEVTDDIKTKIIRFLSQRLKQQDFEFPSCGCIFKNPKNQHAGKLLDACGLKGFRRGDARVSLKHANFIVNVGRARYNEVDYLIQMMKERVYKQFGVLLKEEIRRWG